MITEGGMCIKIIFEQASIELKVIICGAAYPVLVSILAACSGLLCDHDDPRLGGASMVGCSRSADQFYTIVFSLSKKSIAPQRA